ncbi:DUF2933 domain-containing protein [Methylobacter sp. BlB1]|jgi:hypothetical protein|uniref:DUF2933 domain-containing protein n=1 Tax=Methylobacter sp. BlB1 TaxID=2785914 RepID=UPI0018938F56|nr:DUF2933 domain-containing protein [Methylobacter sp. BlB1]MBF6649777.1 DUF2933 domain-containing protein [Methylobacter sp. BlB1]
MVFRTHSSHTHPSGLRYKIALAVLLVVALFFLLTEHRAHFLGILPYMLLLACPLMHFFMHGSGHRHEHNQED